MTVTISWRTLVAFASGLAVAIIAVFVFQAWRVDAAPGDPPGKLDATFVPITPCRLIDTRPAPFRVGTHAAFGEGETMILQARGTNGNCTITNDAVGLSMNVTAVGATRATYLTLWSDGTRPTVASLNPTPGQPPTPNAVTTQLSGSGAFNVFNRFGNVEVIIDVNGYYTKSTLETLRSPWDIIPSGVTVHGNVDFNWPVIADNFVHAIDIRFPASTGIDVESQNVNFSVDNNDATVDDDSSCAGGPDEPTAPPGKVCIYANFTIGMDSVLGTYGSPLGNESFRILLTANGAPGTAMHLQGTWAYTAP